MSINSSTYYDFHIILFKNVRNIIISLSLSRHRKSSWLSGKFGYLQCRTTSNSTFQGSLVPFCLDFVNTWCSLRSGSDTWPSHTCIQVFVLQSWAWKLREQWIKGICVLSGICNPKLLVLVHLLPLFLAIYCKQCIVHSLALLTSLSVRPCWQKGWMSWHWFLFLGEI